MMMSLCWKLLIGLLTTFELMGGASVGAFQGPSQTLKHQKKSAKISGREWQTSTSLAHPWMQFPDV